MRFARRSPLAVAVGCLLALLVVNASALAATSDATRTTRAQTAACARVAAKAKPKARTAKGRRIAASKRARAVARRAALRTCLRAASRTATKKKPTPAPTPAPTPTPTPTPAPVDAAPAAPAAPAIAAPVLRLSATTLAWDAVAGATRYVLATVPDGDRTRTTYSTVSGLSVTPAAQPGHAITYGLRADLTDAPWGDEVRVSYPAAPTSTAAPTPPPAAPAPAVPGSGLALGVSANTMAYSDPSGIQDRVKASGAKWIREPFDWDEIEPQKGAFTWAKTDRTVGAAARRGLNVVALLMSTPTWAGASWSTLASGADYGHFVAAVVSRYGSKGSFWTANPAIPKVPVTQWELWNEPYESFFSAGGVQPGRYAAMAAAGTDAGHAADPAARFMLEATFKSYGGQKFIDLMYQAVPDLNAHFDEVAIHPYGVDATSPSGQFRRTMEETRASFVAHGAADKPFWITEVGWATCPGTSPDCVSEATQAQLLATEIGLFRTTYSAFVRGVILYQWNDHYVATPNPNDSQDWYGLTRRDDSQKPAYREFLKATGVLAS